MGVNIEQGQVIRDVANKRGWKLCGIAKESGSHKSINCYCSGRCFVLDIADLLELVAGHYDTVEIFEHI
jgi:hypothetical protein